MAECSQTKTLRSFKSVTNSDCPQLKLLPVEDGINLLGEVEI